MLLTHNDFFVGLLAPPCTAQVHRLYEISDFFGVLQKSRCSQNIYYQGIVTHIFNHTVQKTKAGKSWVLG